MAALSTLDNHPGFQKMVMRARVRQNVIVMFTDIAFWTPTYGSHSRILTMLTALAGVLDVKVFCLTDISAETAAFIARQSWPFEVVPYARYLRPDNEERFPPGPIAAVEDLKNFVDRKYLGAAGAFLHEVRPSAAIIEYIKLAYLADAFPAGTTRILDTHDAQSLRSRTFSSHNKTASLSVSLAAERRVLSRFDLVLGISRPDCAFFNQDLGLSNIAYVPHAAVPARTPRSLAIPARLAFIGAGSDANVDGLNWFLSQVWPVVRERFTLDIVGSVCAQMPPDINRDKRISMHGMIDDLSPIYAGAIAINPVYYGGGLKVKSLDALAAGCPLVTTMEGARGLEDGAGTAFLLAENRSAFIGHLLALTENPDMAHALSAEAMDYIARHFSPGIAYRELIQILVAV